MSKQNSVSISDVDYEQALTLTKNIQNLKDLSPRQSPRGASSSPLHWFTNGLGSKVIVPFRLRTTLGAMCRLPLVFSRVLC